MEKSSIRRRTKGRRRAAACVLALALALMERCQAAREAQAERYFRRGVQALATSKSEALGHFNQALERNPRHCLALCYKAALSREFADWAAADAALARARTILSAAPENDLLEIMRDRWNPYTVRLRILAAGLLKRPAAIKEAIYGDSDPEVRAAAVDNPAFADPGELAAIALDGERFQNDATATRAVRRITDQFLLKRIFDLSRDYGLRREALLRISDVRILEGIAAGEENPELRRIAAGRIGD